VSEVFDRNNEFVIDDEEIKEISEKFLIDIDKVESLYESYSEFSKYLKKQFLAHVMRGIECYIREYLGDRRFIVICEPYKDGEVSQGDRQASSLYYAPAKTIQSDDRTRSSFIINYSKDLSDKDLRDFIAHEIGHLLIRKLKDEKTKTLLEEIFSDESIKDLSKDWYTIFTPPIEEKYSSIFGIYILSEKNDFYENLPNDIRYKNWQELFNHFHDITHVKTI